MFLPNFDFTPNTLDAVMPETFDKKGATTAVVIGFLSTKFSLHKIFLVRKNYMCQEG